MKKLKLKVITPERLVLEEIVDQVSLPTTLGEITILADHIPLIANLSSGDIVAKSNGDDVPMAVAGGFVEIKKDDDGLTTVAVLADFAEHVFELSDEAVEKARARAEEIKTKLDNKEEVNFEHFAAELERSLTRVRVADKWRTRKYRK
ncbi:MAG TPA: ATP synthase F1 subunit epsilon [Candidatus Paceibacterota bacterium]|nr:ATP synthase F1 subunit epsilon [Candidatus Paceibacterota bacterium]